MIIPPIFSSAGAGNTNTRSANGLMFIILLYFLCLNFFISAMIAAKTVPNTGNGTDNVTHWQKRTPISGGANRRGY
jgi:hypothetical protein